jgi:hypothetical protein
VSPDVTEARLVVDKGRAGLGTVARAALELTDTCYVWLERLDDGVAVTLEEREPTGTDIEARFEGELERAVALDRHERATRGLRAALIARAYGPRAERPQPVAPPAPTLDPETEAEIERLLAEIESDDWLADSGEISKTWEERFGAQEEEKKK